MQAKAGAGSSTNLPAFLQDTRVQIGVGVIAVLAIIFMVWNMIGNQGSSAPPVPPGTAAGLPAGYPGTGPGLTVPGADDGATTPPAAAPTEAAKKKGLVGPKPPHRANPFSENSELRKVEASVPKPPETLAYAAPQNLYGELRKPKPPVGVSDTEDTEGPAVPPMRLAGIIQGPDRLNAMLQMGSQFMPVAPGQKVPDPNQGPFRVDTIEPDRILLSRHWEMGDKKGVQHVEVALSAGTQSAPAFTPGAGAGGYPGGAGGYPGAGGGYPGGGGGGYPGGGRRGRGVCGG